jgi:magnesium transporter
MTLVGTWYGMNFVDQMPELHWKHGYQMAGLVTAISTLLTVWYFKRRKWF